jgi:hypothetical protein
MTNTLIAQFFRDFMSALLTFQESIVSDLRISRNIMSDADRCRAINGIRPYFGGVRKEYH